MCMLPLASVSTEGSNLICVFAFVCISVLAVTLKSVLLPGLARISAFFRVVDVGVGGLKLALIQVFALMVAPPRNVYLYIY